MPAPDIFSIGVSGLQSSQSSLATTSHNIANVNTQGYSRQRAEQETRYPQFFGGSFFGTGTELSNIQRIINQTINLEMRANLNSLSYNEAFLQEAKLLDNLIADQDTGLNKSLQSFFSALQGMNDNPSSIPARQVVLSEAELLANRFNTLSTAFAKQRESINTSFISAASEVTALASRIADLNTNIVAQSSGSNGFGGQPNDLLDERDRLLNELGKLVTVSAVPQGDGAVNVFIGTGQALVVSGQYSTLSADSSDADLRQTNFFLQIAGTGSRVDVTTQMTGGKIAGLLAFRTNVLEPTVNRLGRVAIGIAEAFNDQHALGMDLNNNLGELFFTDFNNAFLSGQRAVPNGLNTGNATLSVSIDNVSQLGDSAYQVSFLGGNYTVTRLSDRAVLGTFAAFPQTFDGFTITQTGGLAANGDSYVIQPTRDGSAYFSRVIDDVREIAAAGPVRAASSVTNQGSGVVKAVTITNASGTAFATPQALTPPIRIAFTSATTFDVLDMTPPGPPAVLGSGLYNPAGNNDMLTLAGLAAGYGYDISLTGNPRTGDTFDFTYNTGGVGDNRNMKLLAELQTENVLDAGGSTFSEAYGRLIADVGTRTHESEINMRATQTLYRQSVSRREEVSGVNLDEEAAQLIKFQQAYEASAQVISVARSLFETLFQSVR